MEEKRDIWAAGIKSIMGYHKRTVLDFIDLLAREANNPREKERLGKIKGRIHNDFGQATFGVGILFSTFRQGGDISEFRDNIFGRDIALRNKRKEEARRRAESIFNSAPNEKKKNGFHSKIEIDESGNKKT